MSRRRTGKSFPQPIHGATIPSTSEVEPPLVLGGSITRSPEGKLWTLQTHRIYASPQTVQEVWSNSTRRRYPAAWEGQPLSDDGYVIEWLPCSIACRCGQLLGDYVAYRVIYPSNPRLRGERGIVEKTSRRYHADPGTAKGQAGSRGPKSRPRFELKGEVGWRAARTTAYFCCPGCRRERTRNFARLGEQLSVVNEGDVFVLS